MAKNLLTRDGQAEYAPNFFATPEADELLEDLRAQLDWTQESARLFGRSIPLPRLTTWYGPTPYTYSGVVHRASPFPEVIRYIAGAIKPLAGNFDCVLGNLYRHGSDSVAWHSDDEAMWGDLPTIASVSFGATRRFALRHKQSGERVSIDLDHGGVLVMSGLSQRCWHHAISKTQRPVGMRINLTFRRLER